MNEEELKKALDMLAQAGMEVMLCDTRVPRSSVGVKCGVPTLPGDFSWENYMLLPKALVGTHPEIFVPAIGDSMTGANFMEGDLLRVQLGVSVRDGDIVLAWIDGSCTVKTFFQDDENLQWLVPQNEAYDAILLTGEYDVHILGRVVGVEKQSPRTSFTECRKYVSKAKTKMKMAQLLTPQQIDKVIREVGGEVKHARQWYAVYRAMADNRQASEGSLADFCERVAKAVPTHRHLPNTREMQRMAVQSFSKPVALWNQNNAPVSGIRFADYLRIAQHTARLLADPTEALPF